MARRLGLPALAYVGLLVVALGVAQRQPDAMSNLVTVLFILLTSAAASAWDLLVKVSEEKRRRPAALVPVGSSAAAREGDAGPASGGGTSTVPEAAVRTVPIAVPDSAPSERSRRRGEYHKCAEGQQDREW